MKIKYIPSLDSRVQSYNEFISATFPHFLTENAPDTILVAGGDGAMHHAIYQNSEFQGIFLGKAMGTLNFLMNTFPDDQRDLSEIENESRELFTSSTETISLTKNGEYLGEAANDVLLGDSINGYHTYQISTEDRFFNEFKVKGTGVCISTPLGSTAYNLNNGGSILPLESKLWSITGIACNRFVKDILPAQKITVKVGTGKIYLSGIDKGEMKEGDELVLQIGKSVRLGFLDKSSFTQRRVDFSHRYRQET